VEGAAEAASIGERGGGIRVLSACPAASDFIAAEYPSLNPALLRIPSPMAICARAALSDAGIPDGTALALSPCSIKKREERLVDFDMRVLSVHSFVAALCAALGESGLELASFPGSDYDRPFPARDGDDCGIACTVAGLLSDSGMPFVSSFAAEGLPAARMLMQEILAARRAGGEGTSVVELTFCEGGCLRDPLEYHPGSGILP
jgi:iron only hydrogenase large subunit-like protein